MLKALDERASRVVPCVLQYFTLLMDSKFFQRIPIDQEFKWNLTLTFVLLLRKIFFPLSLNYIRHIAYITNNKISLVE